MHIKTYVVYSVRVIVYLSSIESMLDRSSTTFVIFLCNLLTVVTSYRCLQCDDVPLPNLCEEIGECGAHEMCAVEQFITAAGSFIYRQSCMDRLKCGTAASALGKRGDLLTCTECCDGELCNAAGCGEKGFDATLGPICYACTLQIGTGTCGRIQQCGRDQECSIEPVRRIGAPDNLFETKCTEKNICAAHDMVDSSMIVGRKRSTCSICCNSTLCNDFDSRPCVPSSTPATVASSTRVTTRMTSSPTTPMQHVTETKTVSTNSFTTAPVTQHVCEDVPGKICHKSACLVMTAYLQDNCRRTCNLCGKPTETQSTLPITTATTETTSTTTPTVPTTTFSSTTSSTTSKSGVTGHTHDPFCRDIAEGCNTFVSFCTIEEYKVWTKSSCRRTCNYC